MINNPSANHNASPEIQLCIYVKVPSNILPAVNPKPSIHILSAVLMHASQLAVPVNRSITFKCHLTKYLL